MLSNAYALRRPGYLATGIVALAFSLSVAAFVLLLVGGEYRGPLFRLDRLSGLMALLVTGISLVVHAFSVQYMDGDPGYRRFFAWLLAVTAAVSCMALANNLVVFAAGWIGTSIALYELQVHYRERPQALAAARLMRRAHLIGDVALAAGCVVLAVVTGQTRIDAIATNATTIPGLPLTIAVALFAIAGWSKSAQLPLHGWLPETLEAPTPVSALMHAGIVNAGGFLLVRFSAVVVHAQLVTIVIFAVGAMTALWGNATMLVRSDMKRGLAYSTMGQMGYMTMQCGLGAFPAAFLHLIAHGIFKATLFLGSGSVVHDFKRAQREAQQTLRRSPRFRAVVALVFASATGWATLVSPLGRALPPYGWVLMAFAMLTCAQAVFALIRRGSLPEYIGALLVAAALPVYALLILWFDRFLGNDFNAAAIVVPTPVVAATIGVFTIVLIAGWGIIRTPQAIRDRVYVWLLNERLPLRGFLQ